MMKCKEVVNYVKAQLNIETLSQLLSHQQCITIQVIMAAGIDTWEKLKETRSRLEKCWKIDIEWSLYPETIKRVRNLKHFLQV